jgi:lipoate-protein ligase A
VQSVRSSVTNIREHLTMDMGIQEFRASLLQYFLDTVPGSALIDLSSEGRSSIAELAEDKYSSWEWNIGYSPKYDLKREFTFDGQKFSLSMHVEKGIVREISLESGTADKETLEGFCSLLKGKRHDDKTFESAGRELEIVSQVHINRFVLNFF